MPKTSHKAVRRVRRVPPKAPASRSEADNHNPDTKPHMPKVRIVTDSSAHFLDPSFPERHHVTVLPASIHFGSQVISDTGGYTTEQLFDQARAAGVIPTAEPPTARQFAAVYNEICKTNDSILSIHISSKLSRAVHNARTGTDEVLGRCKIHVIDSLSTSIGLGLLVEAATLAAE